MPGHNLRKLGTNKQSSCTKGGLGRHISSTSLCMFHSCFHCPDLYLCCVHYKTITSCSQPEMCHQQLETFFFSNRIHEAVKISGRLKDNTGQFYTTRIALKLGHNRRKLDAVKQWSRIKKPRLFHITGHKVLPAVDGCRMAGDNCNLQNWKFSKVTPLPKSSNIKKIDRIPYESVAVRGLH